VSDVRCSMFDVSAFGALGETLCLSETEQT
jgi:hypothetical protein